MIERLKAFVTRLPACVPALEELKQKEIEVAQRAQVWDILKIVSAPLLAAALAWYARGFLG